MWLNILIACAVGVLTYGATLYFDRAAPTVSPVTVAPVSVAGEYRAGAKIPAFSFTDIKGRTHDIGDFKGKIVILNFWASWCPPCLKEFPALLDAAAAHKKDVVLVALSSDHQEEAMQRFLKTLPVKGDNVLIARDMDGKITSGLFKITQLPETILVARDGTARHKLQGADWTPQELRALIEGLKD